MSLSLTGTRLLWALAFIQLLIWAGFIGVMRVYDFVLIDGMYQPSEISAHIAAFTTEQTRAHIWTTATLDVFYPIVYGSFFAGIALRAFGRPGRWLAIPGICAVPLDLTEGVIQILALGGQSYVIVHKAWVTPWKFGLFFSACLISLAAIAVLLKRKFFPGSGR